MRILGIDPGSKITGFGLLALRPGAAALPRQMQVMEAGVLRPTMEDFRVRVNWLHTTVRELIDRLQPDVCVVEKAFHGVNASSSLKLGELRGAILIAAYHAKVPTIDLTPAQVKKVVTGKGAASKEEVAMSLEALLGFQRRSLPFDACDAVAIALTHALLNSGHLHHRNDAISSVLTTAPNRDLAAQNAKASATENGTTRSSDLDAWRTGPKKSTKAPNATEFWLKRSRQNAF